MFDAALHWLGYGLCHQLPARSFFGGGHQVPVCARDTGIYLGVVVSFALVSALSRRLHPAEGPSRGVSAIALGLLAAMAIDGVTSYAGLRATTNEIRLATGIGAGFAIGVFLVPLVNAEIWAGASRHRPLEGPWHVVAWIGGMPALYAVVWWALPLLGALYPLLVALAIVATFVLVNLVLVGLVLPLERRAVRGTDLLWPSLAALGLSAVEIAGAAGIRLWVTALAAWLSAR